MRARHMSHARTASGSSSMMVARRLHLHQLRVVQHCFPSSFFRIVFRLPIACPSCSLAGGGGRGSASQWLAYTRACRRCHCLSVCFRGLQHRQTLSDRVFATVSEPAGALFVARLAMGSQPGLRTWCQARLVIALSDTKRPVLFRLATVTACRKLLHMLERLVHQ